jgi:hypothetical protein
MIEETLACCRWLAAPQRDPRADSFPPFAFQEEISRGVVAGHSNRPIATSLGRAPSTVSRELSLNGGRKRYRASSAEQAAVYCGRGGIVVHAQPPGPRVLSITGDS